MKDKIMMIVFVLILGSILSVILVAVNTFTEPMVLQNEKIKELSTILNAFEIEFTDEKITEIFDSNVEVLEKSGLTYYRVASGEIAYPFEGPGLWGSIIGVMAMEPDNLTISNVAIKFQEETPGLGSRITERSFLDSIINKQFDPELRLVAAGKASSNVEVDGITGATLSSKAFINILNNQHHKIKAAFKGDQ